MDSITQADRDAAALACRLTGWRAVADRLERGWTPDPDTNEGKIIQAFAAHRRTAQAELVELLAGIIDHFGCEMGPGHSHVVPGIWDSDNHPYLAGTRCEWCAHWEAARALAHKDVNA